MLPSSHATHPLPLQAFASLLERMGTTLAGLASNQALLTRVLQYHVLNNILATQDALAAAGTQATRLTGKSVAFSGSLDSGITVQGETNSAAVALAAINGPYRTSTVRALLLLWCLACASDA
jgi:uncharacterized surface protein with fasciclin (FAS1) repeats